MAESIVALNSVSRSFEGNGGTRALSDVDLEISRGETVAISGPSGSGKSTLLNIICGLDIPTKGTVLFEGCDMAAMSDDERTRLRREKIGMVFQTFNLMPTLSALENVELPLRFAGISRSDSRPRAQQALASVGLDGRLGSRPEEMSGGERQRVAIARSIVFGPSLILADEPTGNLDSASGEQVLDLLGRLHDESGMTIVLVTHSEEAAARCRRRVKLLDGRIVADAASE